MPEPDDTLGGLLGPRPPHRPGPVEGPAREGCWPDQARGVVAWCPVCFESWSTRVPTPTATGDPFEPDEPMLDDTDAQHFAAQADAEPGPLRAELVRALALVHVVDVHDQYPYLVEQRLIR